MKFLVQQASPEYAQVARERGGAVLRVVLEKVGELGLVCRRADNTYWWMTTTTRLRCKHTAGVRYPTEEAAYLDLTTYLEHEIMKTAEKRDVLETPLRTYEQRYAKANNCDIESFAYGVQCSLRMSGMPRRPSWARYLIQNDDGTLVWFETKPVKKEGIYTSKTGKSQPIKVPGGFVDLKASLNIPQ